MTASVKSLLEGIIDYAGLFPPAKLELEPAVEKYVEGLSSEHGWMLGRFICPASTITDLEPHLDALTAASPGPLKLALTGGKSEDLNGFLQCLANDRGAIKRFSETHEGRVTVDAYEIKLPSQVVKAGAGTVEELAERASELVASSASTMFPVYELGFEHGPDSVAEALQALKNFNNRWAGGRFHPIIAKIRTGGLDAKMVPSSARVAFFITACERLELAFKATAGLHHPFRCMDTNLSAKVHGFVNVFFATAHARVAQPKVSELAEILECEDATQFDFTNGWITFQDKMITIDQLHNIRRDLALSFGSCSFDEPVEDLKALSLL